MGDDDGEDDGDDDWVAEVAERLGRAGVVVMVGTPDADEATGGCGDGVSAAFVTIAPTAGSTFGAPGAAREADLTGGRVWRELVRAGVDEVLDPGAEVTASTTGCPTGSLVPRDG